MDTLQLTYCTPSAVVGQTRPRQPGVAVEEENPLVMLEMTKVATRPPLGELPLGTFVQSTETGPWRQLDQYLGGTLGLHEAVGSESVIKLLRSD